MRTPASEAKACDFIIGLIYDRCRIRLHAGKEPLIRARLGKRMRLHGHGSLADYCRFLQKEAPEEEFTEVVEALTTPFTRFLREPEHFEFMVHRALPAVLTDGRRKFRVWSAACATGEEPYSIALHLAEHFPPTRGWDWRVLGTDVSTRALAQARAGVYPLEHAGMISPGWLKRHCQQGTGEFEGQFRIRPELAGRVEFEHLNLLAELSFAEPFDLIFCRNVMIYFDRATQEQLAASLARCLVPGGYLLTGHAESLTGLRVPFRCEQPSIYQKL
jgi:chemotaxis protein methyltransferase CheR